MSAQAQKDEADELRRVYTQSYRAGSIGKEEERSRSLSRPRRTFMKTKDKSMDIEGIVWKITEKFMKRVLGIDDTVLRVMFADVDFEKIMNDAKAETENTDHLSGDAKKALNTSSQPISLKGSQVLRRDDRSSSFSIIAQDPLSTAPFHPTLTQSVSSHWGIEDDCFPDEPTELRSHVYQPDRYLESEADASDRDASLIDLSTVIEFVKSFFVGKVNMELHSNWERSFEDKLDQDYHRGRYSKPLVPQLARFVRSTSGIARSCASASSTFYSRLHDEELLGRNYNPEVIWSQTHDYWHDIRSCDGASGFGWSGSLFADL